MADSDPLASATQTTPSVDPLAGWQPVQSAPATNTPPPPQKGVLQTSYNQVPSFNGKGDPLAGDPETQRIRGAFGEGYSVLPESVTRPGERSILYPATQKSIADNWWGPAVNLASDTLGTAVGGVTGVGNSIVTLGNEALGNFGVPEQVRRDLNVELSRSPAGPLPELRQIPGVTPGVRAVDTPAMKEFMQPPAPSLSDVLQRQRAIPSADPVTAAAISLLRGNTPTAPPPPTPFTMTPGPQPGPAPAPPPTARPSGGLLNIPPSPGQPPGIAPIKTQAEMLATAQGYYSPADKQAAAGAMIKPDAADSVLAPLTSQVSTDPHMAIATGNTPLVQLGKDYATLQGQPMSYDAAMELDKRLTAERQVAAKAGNATLAGQIGDVQSQIREKVESLGDSDTTGDPQTLANVAQARQAFTQSRKEGQLNDIRYDASLLPDDKQNTYISNRVTSMLRNDNAMRGWSPDERAALEQSLKSGQPGALTNFGISLIKPFSQAGGAAVGGSVFGTPGAVVGGQIGGGLGESWAAKMRRAVSQVTLDPVSRTISEGVPPPITSAPPPVTSAPLSAQPGGINIPRAPTPSGSPAIFSYRNGVPYDAQGNPIAPTPQWQATARRTGLGQ